MHTLNLLVTWAIGLAGGYVGLYLFLLPHIFLHEAGHFVAGYFCGLRLLRLRVGPLELGRDGYYKTPKPLVRKWRWSWKYIWSGAIVMQASPKALNGLRHRYMLFTLGGVLANFACALLVLPIAIQDSAIGGFCKCFILFAVFMGLANLVPFRSRKLGFDSDGKRLIGLLRNNKAYSAQLYLLTLSARLQVIDQYCRAGKAAEANQGIEALLREGDSLELPDPSRPHLQGLRDLLTKIAAGMASGDATDKSIPG